MDTSNSPHSLRRTLKPRISGAPGLPVVIIAVVAGVVLIGGGIGYAWEAGQKHDLTPQEPVGLAAVVPPLDSFTTVSPVTHRVSSKKSHKHSAAPATVASPSDSPTPSATPSASPTPLSVNVKMPTLKLPQHRAKQALSTTLAFDPAAATQAARSYPVPTQEPVHPSATAPPAAAATPQPTPIYEPAVVVEARFISQVQPIYPEIPKSQGIGGTSVVLVTVGPSGNIISLSVAQSAGNRLLDAAALDAARASKFQAPEVDGHPATQTYRISYTFQL